MRKYIYGAMYLVFIICHPNVAFFMEIKKKKKAMEYMKLVVYSL